MSRHAYYFHVEEQEEQCHAGIIREDPEARRLKLFRCKKTGGTQIEGRTYCPLHVGMFVQYGRMQTFDGHEVYDVIRSQTEAPDGYEADDYGMEGASDV